MGRGLAAILPTRKYSFFRNRISFTLNPGPFTRKEVSRPCFFRSDDELSAIVASASHRDGSIRRERSVCRRNRIGSRALLSPATRSSPFINPATVISTHRIRSRGTDESTARPAQEYDLAVHPGLRFSLLVPALGRSSARYRPDATVCHRVRHFSLPPATAY